MSGSGNVKSGKYPLGEMSGREMSSRGTVLESCIKRHIASLKLFQLSSLAPTKIRQFKSCLLCVEISERIQKPV